MAMKCQVKDYISEKNETWQLFVGHTWTITIHDEPSMPQYQSCYQYHVAQA